MLSTAKPSSPHFLMPLTPCHGVYLASPTVSPGVSGEQPNSPLGPDHSPVGDHHHHPHHQRHHHHLDQPQSHLSPPRPVQSASVPSRHSSSSTTLDLLDPWLQLDPASPISPARARTFPHSRYHELRRLCPTLYGAVLLCYDEEEQRPVAVKRSDARLMRLGVSLKGTAVAEDPAQERRLMRLFAGRAASPHGRRVDELSDAVLQGRRYVLTSLDEYEDDEWVYTVLPYCSRGDLFTLLTSQTRLSESQARTLFRQLLLGVRFMHRLGVVHLDLSLENLLMAADDALLIADFGVARHLRYIDGSTQRPLRFPADDESSRPGKTAYMAPEVYSGQEFDGEACDVWSMGVVLFIMLLGCPPFRVPGRKDQRFGLIYTGQLPRLLQAWEMEDRVSQEGVELLSAMLCEDRRRISVDAALAHPWLQQ